MAARTYRPAAPFETTPRSRRVSGMTLALALNLLFLLLLLGIGGIRPIPMKDEGGTLIFDVSRQDQAAARPEAKPQRKRTAETQRPVVPPPDIVLPVKPTITPPPTGELEMIELTKQELSETDQAMASRSGPAQGSGRGGDSAVVGTGPRGETLYAAEWLREPTDQEIGFYLGSNTASGYGLIACKTYPQYRVDECVALGSVPASARLDRKLLQAAWQFKVRPPRKNGQPMIGEWVRIRIEWNVQTVDN